MLLKISTSKIFFALSLILKTAPSIAAVDESLTERARGTDVVKVVVDKIRKSQIFAEDFNFLQRLAFVETRFGMDSNTFRLNWYGGIWGVNQAQYDVTKDLLRFPNLSEKHTKIFQQFQINWPTATWLDLLKPLHSGLAASLYLSLLTAGTPPQKVAEQARYWAINYNSNTLSRNEATFVNLVAEMQSSFQSNCKMDLVVALDESGSIGDANYSIALQAVTNLFNSYSLELVREGFMTFSTDNKVIFPLNNVYRSDELRALISKARVAYAGGATNTNAAIAFVIDMFQKTAARPGVPKVLVLFTDGKSTDGGSVSNAKVAKAAGIISIAVGISEYNLNELTLIADGVKRHVVTLKEFDTLIEIIGQLSEKICDVPQRPVLNSISDDNLLKGEKRIYSFDLPSTEGLTVYLNSSSGKVVGYYSYDYEFPSAALHDGVLMGDSSVIPLPVEVGPLGDSKTVYVAIQGMDDTNDYSIKAVQGQNLPPYVCAPAIQLIQGDLNVMRKDLDLIKEAIGLLMLDQAQRCPSG